MDPLWSPVVATGGNRSQIGPAAAHGKEGVDGSSPSEGSAKAPHVGAFAFRRTCSSSNVRWSEALYGAFRSTPCSLQVENVVLWPRSRRRDAPRRRRAYGPRAASGALEPRGARRSVATLTLANRTAVRTRASSRPRRVPSLRRRSRGLVFSLSRRPSAPRYGYGALMDLTGPLSNLPPTLKELLATV
jgi:hypothetical protein